MAVCSIILGGFTGFLTFLIALFQFDASLMQAMGLYLLTGIGVSGVLLGWTLLVAAFPFMTADRNNLDDEAGMVTSPHPRVN